MTRVKICGLTNLEDAQVAAAAGADYLGFIFYQESKRAISVEAAKPLIAGLRNSIAGLGQVPLLVGVFVNETPEFVSSVLEACDLDLAQLSGDEPASDVRSPGSPLARRVYRAIRPSAPSEAMTMAEEFAPSPAQMSLTGPDLLLDSYHPNLRGGTGRVADWDIARSLAGQMRLMLAGGLTPSNVSEAIQHVRPFAVDVASGVEASPGRKNHDAVRAFIRASREVSGDI